MSEVLWIDARSRAEYELGRIPQAILLEEKLWDRQLDAVVAEWSPARPIVVYCASSACGKSRDIARRLRAELGVNNVFWMAGGWREWETQAK